MFDASDNENIGITWHTGDLILDPIGGAIAGCPILHNLSTDAYRSDVFAAVNATRGQQITVQADAVFGSGSWNWYSALDCMMTAVCSGHDIPDRSPSIQTGKSGVPTSNMTDELFAAIVNYTEYIIGYRLSFNNSDYAKHFTGPFVIDILTKMQAAASAGGGEYTQFALYGKHFAPCCDSAVCVLIVLFIAGGHDDTISALLSVLLGDSWDMQWPPYVALLSFELYKGSSTHYVRVVYNGRALNMSCSMCPLTGGTCMTLCDAAAFFDMLKFAPIATADCKNSELDEMSYSKPFFKNLPKVTPPAPGTTNEHAGWSFGVVVTMFLVGAVLGALTDRYYSNASRLRRFRNNEYNEIALTERA